MLCTSVREGDQVNRDAVFVKPNEKGGTVCAAAK